MFPIHILEKGKELPKDGTYYVLGKNGFFLRKNTGIVSAMVKVEKISFLQDIEAAAQLHLPKLPAESMREVENFFRAVYDEHGSEAVILIHYNKSDNLYYFECPVQTVSGGAADYESGTRYEGYQLVGSIHSHASMDAFHSSTDHKDEMNFDGIHITFGHMDQEKFTISCEVVVNNNRFKINPEGVIDGIQKTDWKPVSAFQKAKKKVAKTVKVKGKVVAKKEKQPIIPQTVAPMWDNYRWKNKQFYEIKTDTEVTFPKDWMKQVSKQTYTFNKKQLEGTVYAQDQGDRDWGNWGMYPPYSV